MITIDLFYDVGAALGCTYLVSIRRNLFNFLAHRRDQHRIACIESNNLCCKVANRRRASMTETTSTASPTLSPSDLVVGKQVEIEARTWAGINKPGGHGTITKIHTDRTKVDVKYALGGFEKDVELIHVKAHVELERGGRKRRDDVKMNVEHLGGLPKKKSKKKQKRKGTSGAAKKTAAGVGGGGTKTIAAFRQVALSLPTELESGSSLYPADCGAYEYGALNSTPLTSYVENDDCFGCENIMQESDVAGTLLESLSPLSLPGICLNERAPSDYHSIR